MIANCEEIVEEVLPLEEKMYIEVLMPPFKEELGLAPIPRLLEEMGTGRSHTVIAV